MSDEPTLLPLTLQDLEYTAETVVAGDSVEGWSGPGALIAAAFLRLVRHANKTCLGTFEDSLADPEQPLIRDVEHEGEVFHVPGDRPYGEPSPRMRKVREVVEEIARRMR